MADIMYAIVQKDKTGVFIWYREKYDISPFADGVVAIFKGTLEEVFRKSHEFEQASKGESVRLLSSSEISDLLGDKNGNHKI